VFVTDGVILNIHPSGGGEKVQVICCIWSFWMYIMIVTEIKLKLKGDSHEN
jgi:hypothetical protein